MEQPAYDAGIAGSITMIFLTLATVILLRSFYKRWKKMNERRIQDESK
jgi:cytochrome c oxidase assembly factor CtaG